MFCFFSLIISVYYLVVSAFNVRNTEREILRDISFANFGIFIITALVVFIILSEGEILEGFFEGLFEGAFDGSSKKKVK